MSKIKDYLMEEHQKMREHLSRLSALTSKRDWETRELEFARLKDVLLPHFQGEEVVFFHDAVSSDLHHRILHLKEQHSLIRKLISILSEESKQAERWGAQMRVCTDRIINHLYTEEPLYSSIETSLDQSILPDIFEKIRAEELRYHKEMQQMRTIPY